MNREEPLMYMHGEALAFAHDYSAAIDSFSTAIHESRSAALGVAPGWTSILNAWRASILESLSESDALEGAARFCASLETLIGDDLPIDTDDESTFTLCKAASHVRSSQMQALAPLIAKLQSATFPDTYLIRDRTAERESARACLRLASLRRAVDGLPITPVKNLGFRISDSDVIEVRLTPFNIGQCPTSMPLPTPQHIEGKWLLGSKGIGFRTSNQVFWISSLETGWIEIEDIHRSNIERPDYLFLKQLLLNGMAYRAYLSTPRTSATQGGQELHPLKISGIDPLPSIEQ